MRACMLSFKTSPIYETNHRGARCRMALVVLNTSQPRDVKPTKKKKIVFVCGHNAGRSIAAEAIVKRLRGDDLDVSSCGTAPTGRVNAEVLDALQSAGYPVAGLHSKDKAKLGLDWEEYDYIITMGCMDTPLEGAPVDKVRDWGLPDPAKDRSVIPLIIKDIERRALDL